MIEKVMFEKSPLKLNGSTYNTVRFILKYRVKERGIKIQILP